MNIERLEAFTEFAQYLETEHDIPFAKLCFSEIGAGRNSRPIYMLRKDYDSSYPHTICEYVEEYGIFYYQLVGDNKYYYRVKKNDDAKKTIITNTLPGKCNHLIETLEEYIEYVSHHSPSCAIVAKLNLARLKEIINATEKE